MKKIFLTIIAAAAVAGFTSCSEGPTANVHWTAGYIPPTTSGTEPGITDIKWVQNGSEDQTWTTPLLGENDYTETREVTELVGSGTCLEDGISADIEISASSTGVKNVSYGGASATLIEDADVNLIISSAAKK